MNLPISNGLLECLVDMCTPLTGESNVAKKMKWDFSGKHIVHIQLCSTSFLLNYYRTLLILFQDCVIIQNIKHKKTLVDDWEYS